MFKYFQHPNDEDEFVTKDFRRYPDIHFFFLSLNGVFVAQVHLEQMLDIITNEQNEKQNQDSDCLKFVLTRRPLDLLIEFAVTDCPPGKIDIFCLKNRLNSCFTKVQLDACSTGFVDF